MSHNAWIALALVAVTLTIVAIWVTGRGRAERDATGDTGDEPPVENAILAPVSRQDIVPLPDEPRVEGFEAELLIGSAE